MTDSTAKAANDQTSRRDLMLGLGSLAGLASLVAESNAQSFPPKEGRNPETMLLRRASYGVKEADLAEMAALGFDGWLNRQFSMTAADDTVCEGEVKKQFPRVSMSFAQLRTIQDDWETSNQLIAATLYRAVNSKRQLFQRLCEFWFDHLNIYMYKVGAWQTVDYMNVVIRKHALGKFPAMLWACAHHPAMMVYLDNASSEGGNPNQNYARELMELHTLSSTGGYTQTDVEELARCLTGWGMQWDSQQPNYGEFEYHDWAHDDGTKTVLGKTVAAGGGKKDGEAMLQMLAYHPNTAAFIAKKMVRWFMGEGNFATLENLVKQKYLQTGGDIKEMLKVILKRNVLLLASPKFKRPFHIFASGIRTLGAKVNDYNGVRWAYLGQSGHEPYTWPPPNGYPDDTDFWAGLMLPRWNFMLAALSRYSWSLDFDWKKLLNPASTPTAIVARLDKLFFAGELSVAEKNRLLAYLNAGVLDEDRLRGAIALAMCSPAFQWF